MRRPFLARLGLIAVAFAGALSTASCLSPTLPLPPPDVDTSTEAADGQHWIVSGTCTPGALVTLLNDETGLGAVYEDRLQSGHFTIEIEAQRCDKAWVSQQFGTEDSSRYDFVIDTISIDKPSGSGLCK